MYNKQLTYNQQQAIKKVITQEQYYPKPPILYKQTNLKQQQLPYPEHEVNSIKPKCSQDITPIYQPYLPNPEIEKVIKKYKSPEIQNPTQQNQIFNDTKFQEPSSNIVKRPNINNIQEDKDQLNQLNISNQNRKQPINDQILTAKKQEYKNDNIVKLIICCIIILQGLYIISLLNSN